MSEIFSFSSEKEIMIVEVWIDSSALYSKSEVSKFRVGGLPPIIGISSESRFACLSISDSEVLSMTKIG